MNTPFLLDLSHTSHTKARTGIQRVVRSLLGALGEAAAFPVTHDPHLRAWRPLEPWERENLTETSAETKRGARWPLQARMRGRAHRWLKSSREATTLPAGNAGVLVPEVFSSEVATALPGLFAATRGPRVAIFHDAIALKFPELTAPKTVARFPSYLHELLLFDGIAANSEDSRQSLLDFWRWAGVTNSPPVTAIAFGVDAADAPPDLPGPATALPIVLSVGSIEGRKNHVALLEACETLWERGLLFELRLIGLAHAQTGRVALERIRALQAKGRSLCYSGPLSDAAVETAYVECAFTVYPSLMEGFGLPVIESLAHGKPCVCSSQGALGESARGGGCVPLETPDAEHLANAIERLLTSPDDLSALKTAARERNFKSWADYARELTRWMQTLPRRS